jgi:hypothetical protein
VSSWFKISSKETGDIRISEEVYGVKLMFVIALSHDTHEISCWEEMPLLIWL